MLRTCVIGCAAASLLGAVIGCKVETTPNSVTISTKEDAVKDAEKQFKELDAKADELKARVEKATGEEKAKLEQKWKESAGKREAAKKKLDDLKAAAADKWKDVKREADHTFDELKKAVQ